MTEYQKLKRWREQTVRLTVQQLADRTGYSFGRIYEFERGERQEGLERFKLVCAGVFAGDGFDWR